MVQPEAGRLQRRSARRVAAARRAAAAISLAVDRQVFADTVYLGAGEPVYGPETPANKKWYWAGHAENAARSGGGQGSCSHALG